MIFVVDGSTVQRLGETGGLPMCSANRVMVQP